VKMWELEVGVPKRDGRTGVVGARVLGGAPGEDGGCECGKRRRV
jgi:hypothetical protein